VVGLKVFVSVFFLLALGSMRCLELFAQTSGSASTASAEFPHIQYEVQCNTAKAASVLDAVSIAGRICAEPKAIAHAFACNIRQKGTVVTFLFPLHTISSAADASFCAIRHHETDFLELVQMFHPLALHEGRIYVPLEEFLRLLHETGVYSVEQDNALISLQSEQSEQTEQPATIERTIEKTTDKTSKTTTFIAPNDNSPTNQTTTPNPAGTPQSSTKFDKPTRNRYILPDDLKRRGLDTPPRLNYQPQSAKTLRSVQTLLVNILASRIKTYLSNINKRVCATVEGENVGTSLVQAKKQPQSVKPSASATKQMPKKTVPIKTTSDNDFSSAKRKWALDVIVLDAGHGGKDGGTLGFGKTKEKDVALGIVKKLGIFIKKEMPGTKVVFTRTDDTFVELERRGQIANENGGKLFVSIHCNSTPKKPSKANGFEVYILRPGRNEDAARIAEVENSVIKLEDDPKRYKPLTDEQFIIVSMAQSSFVKYSDLAAAMITAEVKKLKDVGVRGVNQAGFIVLVGASMPNMLIETGFLSNKKEEKFLKSAVGQTKLALAICRAIKAYRTRYEEQIRGVAAVSSEKKQAPAAQKTPTKPAPVKKVLGKKSSTTSTNTPTKK
jgi:N-acetylmuramoyl-L-alanine amidase